MSAESQNYLLGVNRAELERLEFQHSVWGAVTNRLFDRSGAAKGWKCLDVGAGPGFVSADLLKRVGPEGEVWALEPSLLFIDELRRRIAETTEGTLRAVHAPAERAELPEEYFDLVFIRWVIAFVPDPVKFLYPLLQALKPGGVLAVQDYYYEGLSLFPHGGAFDGMADIVRAYYKSGGGDAYVTGRLPGLLRSLGCTMTGFVPNQLAGGPEDPVFEWADRFFTPHIPLMAEKGLITPGQASALLDDWQAHRADPNALFFSPIVVDLTATKNQHNHIRQERGGYSVHEASSDPPHCC